LRLKEVKCLFNLVTKLFNAITEMQKNRVDTLAEEVQESLKEGLGKKGKKGGKGKDRFKKGKKKSFLDSKF
jgi:hypothetical protein